LLLILVVAACGRHVARQVEVGELLGEPEMGAARADVLEVREVGLEAADEAGQRLAVGEAELGRELVVVEQAAGSA